MNLDKFQTRLFCRGENYPLAGEGSNIGTDTRAYAIPTTKNIPIYAGVVQNKARLLVVINFYDNNKAKVSIAENYAIKSLKTGKITQTDNKMVLKMRYRDTSKMIVISKPRAIFLVELIKDFMKEEGIMNSKLIQDIINTLLIYRKELKHQNIYKKTIDLHGKKYILSLTYSLDDVVSVRT